METLSDKIMETNLGSLLAPEDVKEFIKQLIANDFINTNGQFIVELRKLAGDKLI